MSSKNNARHRIISNDSMHSSSNHSTQSPRPPISPRTPSSRRHYRNDSDPALQFRPPTHPSTNTSARYCSSPNKLEESFNNEPDSRSNARQSALDEASAVLSADEYSHENYLDTFNLLGVVTTPRLLNQPNRPGGVHRDTSTGSTGSINRRGSMDHHSNTSSSGIGTGSGPGTASSHVRTGNITNTTTNDNTNHANANANANANGATSNESTLIDPQFLLSVSETLSKEIDYLNSAIYSYSQNYLGNYYLSSNEIGGLSGGGGLLDFQAELGYEDIPTNQLEELPEELVSLDLTSVEGYLRKCGGLAVNFGLRDGESERVLVGEGEISSGEVQGSGTEKEGANTGDSDDDNVEDQDEVEVDEEDDDPTASVPEIFFSPYFDLTDPKTFESLLVLDDDGSEELGDTDEEAKQQQTIQDEKTISSNAKRSQTSQRGNKTKNLINIQKPEELTQHLDTIELALLNQVRSKSDSFFRETNRFSYLKSLVAESVDEVQSLRSHLHQIRERTVTDVELIPHMDKRREDMKVLGHILDQIMDIVEVKGSVPGLIAAGDYLGAVEAVHMARRLLKGDSDTSLENGDHPKRFALGKLTALNKVNSQLVQYENLVVMDLSNDLVEIFLMWGGSSSASSASAMSAYVNGGGSISSSNTVTIPAERRSKVKQTILALKMCRKLSTMADLYRDKLCDMIRVTVRTTVSECAADAGKEEKLLPIATATATSTSPPNKSKNYGGSNGMHLKQNGHEGDGQTAPKSSITEGVISMSFEQFMDCLDMMFEQILALLQSAVGVSKFCREEGIILKDEDSAKTVDMDSSSNGTGLQPLSPTRNTSSSSSSSSSSISTSALFAAADLSHKSITELLRLRKEAHSLITFEEMKRLWDSCLAFTLQVEKFSGQKAYGLRSTLLAQAKAFVERRHEGNMANLVAALDGERWTQCDVSAERQAALTRLCSGRAVFSSTKGSKRTTGGTSSLDTTPDAEVEGKRYRVVWSCLLLVEMVMSNVGCAAHFQTLATNVVGKVAELLRLFNSRASQLVLGAGAIHSAARLKSINAKHLALVTQCLGLVLGILPHIRAALMAQLPSKQHTLLIDLDKIKKEYTDHNEKVLSKFVSIIGGIVEHGLVPRIGKTDFDARSKSHAATITNSGKKDGSEAVVCCPFLEAVITNTRKMHQVLKALLPPEDLMDVFSRIFSYLDSKIPTIFITADSDESKPFSFPTSDEGKIHMIKEVEAMTMTLNHLPGVRPWDFAAMKFLERRLEISLHDSKNAHESQETRGGKMENIESNKKQQKVDEKTHQLPEAHESTVSLDSVEDMSSTHVENAPDNVETDVEEADAVDVTCTQETGENKTVQKMLPVKNTVDQPEDNKSIIAKGKKDPSADFSPIIKDDVEKEADTSKVEASIASEDVSANSITT